MKQSDIPDHHHFARYASPKRIVRRNDGIEELTPDAFRMRTDEDGLSGSYFEYFGTDEAVCTARIGDEWRAQGIGVRTSGRMALALAEKIKEVGARLKKTLRVRHEPDAQWPSYSQIRGEVARINDDLALLETLAREAVVRLISCGR